MVRWRAIILFLLGLAVVATAGAAPSTSPTTSPDPRQAQVQAAINNASSSLHDQVMHMSLAKGVDVRLLIERTGSEAMLTDTLQNAQQIGGPRWIDERTCQIRLEI